MYFRYSNHTISMYLLNTTTKKSTRALVAFYNCCYCKCSAVFIYPVDLLEGNDNVNTGWIYQRSTSINCYIYTLCTPFISNFLQLKFMWIVIQKSPSSVLNGPIRKWYRSHPVGRGRLPWKRNEYRQLYECWVGP
jgi:hypothetical protein